jgi:DNA processing protein
LEQGREVFAIPGSITSLKSSCTNSLIKAGAKLIDSSESILEELLPAYDESLKAKKESIDPELDNDQERKIFYLLSLEGRHIDDLIENSNLSPEQVSATLL